MICCRGGAVPWGTNSRKREGSRNDEAGKSPRTPSFWLTGMENVRGWPRTPHQPRDWGVWGMAPKVSHADVRGGWVGDGVGCDRKGAGAEGAWVCVYCGVCPGARGHLVHWPSCGGVPGEPVAGTLAPAGTPGSAAHQAHCRSDPWASRGGVTGTMFLGQGKHVRPGHS